MTVCDVCHGILVSPLLLRWRYSFLPSFMRNIRQLAQSPSAGSKLGYSSTDTLVSEYQYEPEATLHSSTRACPMLHTKSYLVT